MDKKVSEKDIKRVVREWMKRLIKIHETRHGVSTDQDIECPQCGGYNDISFYHEGGWRNRSHECSFRFPAHLVPPSPEQFENYLRNKELAEKIKIFLNSK